MEEITKRIFIYLFFFFFFLVPQRTLHIDNDNGPVLKFQGSELNGSEKKKKKKKKKNEKEIRLVWLLLRLSMVTDFCSFSFVSKWSAVSVSLMEYIMLCYAMPRLQCTSGWNSRGKETYFFFSETATKTNQVGGAANTSERESVCVCGWNISEQRGKTSVLI